MAIGHSMTLGHFDRESFERGHLVQRKALDWELIRELFEAAGGDFDLLKVTERCFSLVQLEGGAFLHINQECLDESNLPFVIELIRAVDCDVFLSGWSHGTLHSATEFLEDWEREQVEFSSKREAPQAEPGR